MVLTYLTRQATNIMCKVVYLTYRRFDIHAKEFCDSLSAELKRRNVEVISQPTDWLSSYFRRHKTYGIALAIDFFRDGEAGRGLTLNRKCSSIGRDFAYNLSNTLDYIVPRIHWRNFQTVDSYHRPWFRFFNKVSAETKAIFHLCTIDNEIERDTYKLTMEKVVKAFADEIVRCLRSDYDRIRYNKQVKLAKLRTSKISSLS